MRSQRHAAVIAAAAILQGCIPAQYSVTYQSFPAGAVISESGKIWGRAPVSLTYQNPERKLSHTNRGATCSWDSGAWVATGNVTVDLRRNRAFVVSCARPESAPDAAIDLDVADRLTQQRQAAQAAAVQQSLQQRQTDAAEASMAIDVLQFTKP